MNLRDRARTLLRGLSPSPPPEVQSYNVACPEGHRLRGQRTVGYQALRCPTCGEGIFVLPRSPLPDPPVPTPGRARQPVTAGAPDLEPEPIALTDPVLALEVPETGRDREIVWQDESPGPMLSDPVEASVAEIEQEAAQRGRDPVPRKPHPSRGQRNPTARMMAGRAQERSPSRPEPVTAGTVIAPRLQLTDWVRRRRNPLLFLTVGLLIVATIGIRQWRQHRQDQPRIAALGRVEGLAALEEGDFDRANQLLSAARRAVESLGDAVEGASQIRQGAAEAAIFVNLVPERLESILDEAGRYDTKEWPAHFATLYKGRSIIVDAHVIAVPDAPGSGRYELDYQVLPDGEGRLLRVARIDTAGFHLFEHAQPKVGDRVQFGARLASFTYDDRIKEWLVGLEPDSGVFLTHPGALEALGWPSVTELSAKERAEP